MSTTQRDRTEPTDEATDAHYIYCQQCGFYPSTADDVVIGHREERKAANVAISHEQATGHHAFVVPAGWLDGNRERRVEG